MSCSNLAFAVHPFSYYGDWIIISQSTNKQRNRQVVFRSVLVIGSGIVGHWPTPSH